jgi:hypothetical protein
LREVREDVKKEFDLIQDFLAPSVNDFSFLSSSAMAMPRAIFTPVAVIREYESCHGSDTGEYCPAGWGITLLFSR